MAPRGKKPSGPLAFLTGATTDAVSTVRRSTRTAVRSVEQASKTQGVKPRDIVVFDRSGRPTQPLKTKKQPRPAPRVQPRVQGAGVGVGSVGRDGPLGWAFSPPGQNAIRGSVLGEYARIDRDMADLPPAWRNSLKANAARREIEQTIRRGYYDTPTAYIGRTISNAAEFGRKVVIGMPAASLRGVYLVGRGAQAIGLIPSTPEQKISAAKELGGEAKATGQYYGDLTSQFVRDPKGTIERRGAELALAGMLGWSTAGQGAALVSRGAAQTARLSRATQQGGGLRAGVRIYRGENKRLTAENIRDLQLRDLAYTASSSNRHTLPSFGARTGRYVFRAADELEETARRAAEITGNAVSGPVGRALLRAGDWGSRSTLPGSPRYRDPRVVVDRRGQQATNAGGQTAGPPGEVIVPQRPRSSNPLTQIVQRRVTERGGGRVRAAIDDTLARSLHLTNLMSSFALASSRMARNMGYSIPADVDAGVYQEGRDLAKMVGKLKGAGRSGQLPESEVARGTTAAIIRSMGITEPLDGSRTWGRDEIISRLNGYLEDNGKRISRRDRRNLNNVLTNLKSIPDEWLDPTTSPRWLNELEGETRRVLRRSGEIKQQMGLISPETMEWGGRRAQAQFGFRGRALETVRKDVYAGPRRDAARAARMREEVRARAKNKSAYSDLSDYSTQALQTMSGNLERRAKTIRVRVKPYLRAAEADAFSAFDDENILRGAVDEAQTRVRELESRPDTAEVRQEIKEARAEFNELVRFLRGRARTRRDMVDRGASFDTQNRRRKVRERETAERVAERESLEFERDRAAARVRMAAAGRRAMARADAGRARREVVGARRSERQAAPSVSVALGRAAAGGERKGRAQARTRPNPDGPPSASRSRAFGTMLRADGGLYVARQQQARAGGIRRSEVEPALRRQGEARAGRRQLSEAELRAMKELQDAQAQLRALRSRPRQRTPAARTTPAQRQARADVARATVSTRRGIPEEALDVYERIKDLQRALAAMRAGRNGTPQQIAAARRQLAQARRRLVVARRRYGRFAYVGATGPQRAGLAPGEYFPQQSPLRGDQDTRFNTTVFGPMSVTNDSLAEAGARAGANLSPRQEQFNKAILADDGLILLSPRVVIDALRSALDAKTRAEAASAFVTKFAYKANGKVLTGNAARRFVDENPGTYTLITERNLARISSLSSDSISGRELQRMLDELDAPTADRVVAVPTAAIRGWRTALDPGGPYGRTIDYISSLWKGGVLALNPRWYIQNFFGMWGQFALGAGADLAAINMARNPEYLNLLPSRISQMGLSQEFGEFARKAQGDATNILGSIIRAGYHGNAALESVPRRAMAWHVQKKKLTDNKLLQKAMMDEGLLAAAWLDVARAAGKGDPGANSIVDQALVETERFMGNYTTYNLIERRVLRRIFPFYAWMRAINRLAFALPVKHPKRAALLAAASYMAYDDRNDVSGYQKGLWFGDLQAGMMTFNPFSTVLATYSAIDNFGQNLETQGIDVNTIVNGIFDAGKAALEQAGPVFGEGYRALSGQSMSGMPSSFPEGYQGFRTQPGLGEMVRTNPATGEREYGPPSLPVLRQLEGLVPFTALARRGLAGGRPVYSNVGVLDLLNYRLRRGVGMTTPYEASQIFQRENQNRFAQNTLLGEATGFLFGIPITQYNPDRLNRYQRGRTEQFQKGLKSSRRREMQIQMQAIRDGR